MDRPDYLVIGHLAHDETPEGPRLGGTVSYAGSAAAAMGARVAVLTSARDHEPVLPGLAGRVSQLHVVSAPSSTVFVNMYSGETRRQQIKSRAFAPLRREHIPAAWHAAPIIHLGPLNDEVDPALARAFPGAFVAATPQGWMRAWDAQGFVEPRRWEYAEALLPILNAAIFSEEDIGRDATLEAYYASLARLLIVTRAANGCTVYRQGCDPLNIPAPRVRVVDATGAGDIFAGIFLVMLARTNDVMRAAEIATQLASISVTRAGLEGVPTQAEIRDALGS